MCLLGHVGGGDAAHPGGELALGGQVLGGPGGGPHPVRSGRLHLPPPPLPLFAAAAYPQTQGRGP